MSYVLDIASGMTKNLPVLLAKFGTVLLIIFTIGLFAGYFFATAGYNYFILLVPIASIVVMWQKLDEGALVLIALLAIAVLFPEIFLT